jgi:uncharacterized protein
VWVFLIEESAMSQSLQHLPSSVDAIKLARQEMRLNGVIDFRHFPRLAAELAEQDGSAEVDLEFFMDEQRIRRASGVVEAQLRVHCQRCLDVLELDINTEVAVGFVASDDQAKNLPRSLDPVMLEHDSGFFSLYELVEDELLLALPLAASHSDCEQLSHEVHNGRVVQADADAGTSEAGGDLDLGAGDQEDVADAPEKDAVKQGNPFASLAKLKDGFGDS